MTWFHKALLAGIVGLSLNAVAEGTPLDLCNIDADSMGLEGPDRKEFVDQCMSYYSGGDHSAYEEESYDEPGQYDDDAEGEEDY